MPADMESEGARARVGKSDKVESASSYPLEFEAAAESERAATYRHPRPNLAIPLDPGPFAPLRVLVQSTTIRLPALSLKPSPHAETDR